MLYQDNPQPPYSGQQPLYHHEDVAPVVKFSDWMITLIIVSIPVVNFIMLIVWATESGGNPSRVNWAKASLVIISIQAILGFFLLGAFLGTISHVLNGLNQISTW